MPNITNQKKFATALRTVISTSAKENKQKVKDLEFDLSEQIGVDQRTLASWTHPSNVPSSIDDGTLYGLLWLLANKSPNGAWMMELLSFTSTPVPKNLTRDWVFAVFEKARVTSLPDNIVPDEAIRGLVNKFNLPTLTYAENIPEHQVTNSNISVEFLEYLDQKGYYTKFLDVYSTTYKKLFLDGQWQQYIELNNIAIEHLINFGRFDLLAEVVRYHFEILCERDPKDLDDFITKMERIAHEAKSTSLKSETHLARANQLYKQNLYNESRKEYEQARYLFEKRKDFGGDGVIEVINSLGEIESSLGNYDISSSNYFKAFNYVDKLVVSYIQPHWRSVLIGNLCIVQMRQGRSDLALEPLHGIKNNIISRSTLAELYITIAVAEYRIGNFIKAHQYGVEGDKIAKQLQLMRPICKEDLVWLELRDKLF